MGVLACDRYGCTNIMCDRLQKDGTWYLCHECFDELVTLGHNVNLHKFMEREVIGTDPASSRAYWNEIFPLRH